MSTTDLPRFLTYWLRSSLSLIRSLETLSHPAPLLTLFKSERKKVQVHELASLSVDSTGLNIH